MKLPEWGKDYLSKNKVDPEVIKKHSSDYAGKVYRGLTFEGLDRLFRSLKRFPKVGETLKFEKADFLATSKDPYIAKSHANKNILGRDPEDYEIPIELEAVVDSKDVFVDFEEFDEYKQLKLGKEREVLVSPDITFKVIGVTYPNLKQIKDFLNPDLSWLFPDKEAWVKSTGNSLLASDSVMKKYLDFVEQELL